jgi:hypothetical protein
LIALFLGGLAEKRRFHAELWFDILGLKRLSSRAWRRRRLALAQTVMVSTLVIPVPGILFSIRNQGGFK